MWGSCSVPPAEGPSSPCLPENMGLFGCSPHQQQERQEGVWAPCLPRSPLCSCLRPACPTPSFNCFPENLYCLGDPWTFNG